MTDVQSRSIVVDVRDDRCWNADQIDHLLERFAWALFYDHNLQVSRAVFQIVELVVGVVIELV